MQNTTNFNLNKPEGTDIYNIQNENDNMDIIDAALAKAHSTDDSASTDLADGDYLPFYDTSATEKKKMLLSTARKDVRARIAEAVSNDVIETIGAKALNSYSVGQYFLGNDGYYYAATAAITANTTTLNSGVSGNCSKTSIAAGMNSLSSQISNLEGKATFIQRVVMSEGVAVPANSYGIDTVDISYPGYTPIFCAPVGTNHNNAWVTVFSLSENIATTYVWSTTAQTVRGVVRVLYQKSV